MARPSSTARACGFRGHVRRRALPDRRSSFHPYSSKFDAWLEGRAQLTPAELRGYQLFNDQDKANCAGCHIDQPSKDGLPPLFTDHQYEALGAPRNRALRANRDPAYFDLGICGPVRDDMRTDTQFCGMFLTPTLRNVATRKVFFHNGVFHSLWQVMDFYNFRDTDPARVYPHGQFDDLPHRYWNNIDESDPPFGRKPGEAPAMTAADEQDIIAFLGTLTDGYERAAAVLTPCHCDHRESGGKQSRAPNAGRTKEASP